MHLYLAGAETWWPEFFNLRVRNILFSYFYMRTMRKRRLDDMLDAIRREQHRRFKAGEPAMRIILDSGAFTFLASRSKAKAPDPYAYAEDWLRFVESTSDLWTLCAELDIDKPTKTVKNPVGPDDIDRWRNDLYSIVGRRAMPVWHPHQGYQEWTDLVQDSRFPYLGLGSDLADIKVKMLGESRLAGKKVHGFAETKLNTQAINLKYTSVDSTTWLRATKYGGFFIFEGGKLRILDHLHKAQRRLFTAYYTRYGLDLNKILKEDQAELTRASLVAWREMAVWYERTDPPDDALPLPAMPTRQVAPPVSSEPKPQPSASETAMTTRMTMSNIKYGSLPDPRDRSTWLAPDGMDKCIAARNTGRDWQRAEVRLIDEIGNRIGCWTCGAPEPGGTHWIKDHYPATDELPPCPLNLSGDDWRKCREQHDGQCPRHFLNPQVLLPQCHDCSLSQGGGRNKSVYSQDPISKADRSKDSTMVTMHGVTFPAFNLDTEGGRAGLIDALQGAPDEGSDPPPDPIAERKARTGWATLDSHGRLVLVRTKIVDRTPVTQPAEVATHTASPPLSAGQRGPIDPADPATWIAADGKARCLPDRRIGGRLTAADDDRIQAIGERMGCSPCGARKSGAPDGRWHSSTMGEMLPEIVIVPACYPCALAAEAMTLATTSPKGAGKNMPPRLAGEDAERSDVEEREESEATISDAGHHPLTPAVEMSTPGAESQVVPGGLGRSQTADVAGERSEAEGAPLVAPEPRRASLPVVIEELPRAKVPVRTAHMLDVEIALAKVQSLPGLNCAKCAVKADCPWVDMGENGEPKATPCKVLGTVDSLPIRDHRSKAALLEWVVTEERNRTFLAVFKEKQLNGGQIDPHVSNQLTRFMNILQTYYETVHSAPSPAVTFQASASTPDGKIAVTGSGQAAGGLISKLFGGASPPPPRIEVPNDPSRGDTNT